MKTKTDSSQFYQACYKINSWCSYETTESAKVFIYPMHIIIKIPLIGKNHIWD